MTRFSRTWLAVAAFAIAGTPAAAAAQIQPATKAAPPSAQAGAPTTQRMVTPPAPLTANPASVPSDSAVALCMDNSFVKDPGTVADCAKHGGLRVAMPPHGNRVVARKAGPAVDLRAAAVNQLAPASATMRCKDGTYLTGAVAADRCANNGGVATIIPAAPPTPPPPPKRP